MPRRQFARFRGQKAIMPPNRLPSRKTGECFGDSLPGKTESRCEDEALPLAAFLSWSERHAPQRTRHRFHKGLMQPSSYGQWPISRPRRTSENGTERLR